MAANDYYHGPSADRFDAPPADRLGGQTPYSSPSHADASKTPYSSPSHADASKTPYSSSSHADASKPLPPPGPYPSSSFGPGYSSDLSYAPQHYSAQSVDTTYHGGGGKYDADPAALHHNGSPSHAYYAENIPLAAAGAPPAAANYDFDPDDRGGRRRKAGFWRSRPWFVYTMTAVHVAVFCFELAQNSALQGSVIATKPAFNPMIGPSTDVLISIGARYVPCMRALPAFNNTTPGHLFPCPGRTDLAANCTLAQRCGFGGAGIAADMGGRGAAGSWPAQWYRFVLPMFFHAGLVHLALNLFMQLLLGGEMEALVGPLRFALIYAASGVFGFVLGGNLGAFAQPSVGASGSLFGIFALVLLDILYAWPERARPARDLAFLLLDMALSFVLGLLPGVDNFAHIGGFVCGLALGLALMRSPARLRARIGAAAPPYTPATAENPYNTSSAGVPPGFVRQPLAFFKGRKPLWWAWWAVRAAMLALVLVLFVVLLNNFYSENMRECRWCRRLSCLPIKGWCDVYDYKS